VLRGRASECEALDRLLGAVRAGESRALVLRGEPGVGKSTLLEYLVQRAAGCRVVQAAGVQSEMELAFAGLHQLCASMLDRLERLPAPQRDALGTAFGLGTGEAPDRFLVGLAILSLLAEVAEERPLLCVVDDAQWLDRASAQTLQFVARRLMAESVALVFAARESCGEEEALAGLPDLLVEGLSDDAASALLGSVVSWPLDERVRDRIVAETRGNPLALLELPRGLTPPELAGGFGLPDAGALPGRIEESFQRRLGTLPADGQLLLLIAAAEPVGEPLLLWRAARRLGIGVQAKAPVAATGLLEFGSRVWFRHPLVRSAVYRAASLSARRRVHGALADATDPEVDPDRRAWHRAQATAGPDEDVAGELERSAGRAQARGGMAAAAAFLEKAAELTPEPARRGERALAAAEAKRLAGAHDAALALLAGAEAGPLDELQRARLDLLRAQIAFASRRGRDAPSLLLRAAKRLEPLDVALARDTYLDAVSAAMFVAHLFSDVGALEVGQGARAAPRPPEPLRAADLLLDGLAVLITEGYAAGVPTLKRALSAFRSEQISRAEELRWLWLAGRTAGLLWDFDTWDVLTARHVRVAREAGALTVLTMALNSRIGFHTFAGEFAAAASLVAELDGITEAAGIRGPHYGALTLAAWRGREADVSELTEGSLTGLMRRGEGLGLAVIQWAGSVLYLGLGRYEDALAAAGQASDHPQMVWFSSFGSVELVEAAVRGGQRERAAAAFRRVTETTGPSGTDWALGIEACARALLSDGEDAERLYREAIDRLGRTRLGPNLARAHLLYGEWLRRERRRLDAREHLRLAHEAFSRYGAEAFAQRAGNELMATGETARSRSVETRGELTAQEAQIARLARDGLSNPEIGARLFISRRTVEYHLRKVFAKLDISSRNQLDRALPGEPPATQPA
jgi:DNA-binding CsgD family transcriptional regulator